MIIFVSKDQFLLLPTVGLVVDRGIWLTFAFMRLGVAFRLLGKPDGV